MLLLISPITLHLGVMLVIKISTAIFDARYKGRPRDMHLTRIVSRLLTDTDTCPYERTLGNTHAS